MDEECWICLSSPEEHQPLQQPCACPRRVHPRCLARWRLQKAGKREETHCRFCSHEYSTATDWRTSLRRGRAQPGALQWGGGGQQQQQQHQQHQQQQAPPPQPRPPTPIMAIFFEGQVHRVKVYPGPEGKARFEQQIRQLIQLEEGEEFDVEFECMAPDSGSVLHLDGIDAFEAATHCAALTAAERVSLQAQPAQQPGEQQQQQHAGPVSSPAQQQEQQPPPPGLSHQGSFAAAVQLVGPHWPVSSDSCPHAGALVPDPAGHTAGST